MVENENAEVLQQEDEQQLTRQKKYRKRIAVMIFAILLLSSLTGFIMFMKSDSSHVKSIRVIGDECLDSKYIIDACGISFDTNYYLLSKSAYAKKGEASDLIESVKITKNSQCSVTIEVKEKKIVGYCYEGTGNETEVYLILSDGSKTVFKREYVKNLSIIPLFVDIEDSKIMEIAPKLAALDDSVLYRISEVRNFALSYDYDMVKFVMDDGFTVFSFKTAISYLSGYLEILDSYTSVNSCILLDDTTQSALAISCEELEGADLDDPSYVEGNE